MTIDLSKAAPLSEWKTRDGHRAVFGCWNPDAKPHSEECIGWIDDEAYGWAPDGYSYDDRRESFTDIVAPWPKEPLIFETTIVRDNALVPYIYNNLLRDIIGKRVRVTVEELP